MPDRLTTTQCEQMGAVLSGRYRMKLDDSVTMRVADLPGDCPAAMVRQGDRLLLVIDLDKPMALRHASAMLTEWRQQHSPELASGDDDLDRDWLRAAGIPEPRESTDCVKQGIRVTPVVPKLSALTQVLLTGAGAAVAAWGWAADAASSLMS